LRLALPVLVEADAAVVTARAVGPSRAVLAALAAAREAASRARFGVGFVKLAVLPAGVQPPWALSHDPGAQASYVRAEQVAATWAKASVEAIAPALVAEVTAIDRRAIAAVQAIGSPYEPGPL
jgi:hypothetical protein